MFYGQNRMDNLSCLQKQNTGENPRRYGVSQLPTVLSEMQTGKFGECKKTEYTSYERARRIDAEPIICE